MTFFVRSGDSSRLLLAIGRYHGVSRHESPSVRLPFDIKDVAVNLLFDSDVFHSGHPLNWNILSDQGKLIS